MNLLNRTFAGSNVAPVPAGALNSDPSATVRHIDNSAAERAIKPFAIGRKAQGFSDTVNGASASAEIYSLVETAKINGQESYTYLRHVLERLQRASSVADYPALMPWDCSPEMPR